MKTELFISWSKARSKAVAETLFEWLPNVIQTINPFISSQSIDKGSLWNLELSCELNKNNFGIVCLTPENQKEPWILFEAGAISKTYEKARVFTYLFQLKPSDIEPPLSSFNHTVAEKDDTEKLLLSINKLLEEPRPEDKVRETFNKWWPDLEAKLLSIDKMPHESEEKRTVDAKLEEILLLTRSISQQVAGAVKAPRYLGLAGAFQDDAPALSQEFLNELVKKMDRTGILNTERGVRYFLETLAPDKSDKKKE